MKICVAGLGIIGGSICMALKRAGYAVDGYDISPFPPEYALNNDIIDGVADRFDGYDTVFVAMPYGATLNFILNTRFKAGAVVSDICGVKKPVEDAVLSYKRNFSYVGCHPMAGKEVSGIENACAELFDGKNMVITGNSETDEKAVETVMKLTEEMGFGYIVRCSAGTHDRKIAYTSQLAHVVSNAYVKDADLEDCLGFTGGSFQDMTRIAGVDEEVWAALYLANAENVTEKISSLISSLGEIKRAIAGGDAGELKKILAVGRKLFDGSKKNDGKTDISVRKLR